MTDEAKPLTDRDLNDDFCVTHVERLLMRDLRRVRAKLRETHQAVRSIRHTMLVVPEQEVCILKAAELDESLAAFLGDSR